jgi:2,3-bisphosphoglycerate-independent phosphoglycerate mutase
MILDGWGIGKHNHSNAIYTTGAPNMDALAKSYPNSQLMTCGEYVGLPEGQMGNSEVGHLNIGAGRVVYQDLVKINRACRDNSILKNEEVKKVFQYVKENNKQLHLLGLVSDGGVHSSLDHLFKLCDVGKIYGIKKLFVHCFMDGRDTDPRSGKGFIESLQKHLTLSTGKIASVIGRYYAMDRDKRWERIKIAYELLVNGKGTPVADAAEGVQESYDAGITDEFIKPIVCTENGQAVSTIQAGDAVIFFNFRNDRAKELTIVFTQPELLKKAQEETNAPDSAASAEAKTAIIEMRNISLYYCTITPYDEKFKGLRILFDKDNVQNTLGDVLAKNNRTQLRIAETEKYAHVTFFLSGGCEKCFMNEERILIASPKVATYDLQPEMSAFEVKDALVAALKTQKYDFIALNLANGDMVGHTGVYDAICKAVKAVDACVGEVVQVAQENGYAVLITADHGNADNAENPDGTPNTAHSLNPVPFIVVDKDVKKAQDGILSDIAPTVLRLMGVPQPQEMTGKVLVG